MVLYGFKQQFAAKVEDGSKPHTIRNLRKNGHAKPGDLLQLYSGLRTKDCRKLLDPDPVCWETFPIWIEAQNMAVLLGDRQDWLSDGEIEALAIADGFDSVKEFFDFFPADNEKILICWQPVEWLEKYR